MKKYYTFKGQRLENGWSCIFQSIGKIFNLLFSHSVVSDSFRPNKLQHTRPPCPIPTPRAYPNSIESVTPSNHLILYRPLLLLPSIFPSIRIFSNESALRMRWPKYWSFIFNIRHSNEHPGLISFRMDWLDLLAASEEFFSNTTVQKHQYFSAHFLYSPTLTSIHDYWKNYSFD